MKGTTFIIKRFLHCLKWYLAVALLKATYLFKLTLNLILFTSSKVTIIVFFLPITLNKSSQLSRLIIFKLAACFTTPRKQCESSKIGVNLFLGSKLIMPSNQIQHCLCWMICKPRNQDSIVLQEQNFKMFWMLELINDM